MMFIHHCLKDESDDNCIQLYLVYLWRGIFLDFFWGRFFFLSWFRSFWLFAFRFCFPWLLVVFLVCQTCTLFNTLVWFDYLYLCLNLYMENWRKQWKIEGNHGKFKKTMEQLKKTMRQSKKTMRQSKKTTIEENHGKIEENHGKIEENHANHGQTNENDGKLDRNHWKKNWNQSKNWWTERMRDFSYKMQQMSDFSCKNQGREPGRPKKKNRTPYFCMGVLQVFSRCCTHVHERMCIAFISCSFMFQLFQVPLVFCSNMLKHAQTIWLSPRIGYPQIPMVVIWSCSHQNGHVDP